MIKYHDHESNLKFEKKNNDKLVNQAKEIPIINGIPRFVPINTYADAFGLQWNTYKNTQIDSVNGYNISLDRLERCLGDSVSSLRGKQVLEAGCGAGRFTEHLTKNGANTHAFDLSSAVDANKDLNGHYENYQIAQADIRSIPYEDNVFDFVICLGVIQHTPNPKETIKILYKKVKRGGYLIFDSYTYNISQMTKLSGLYRQLLKRLNPKLSMEIVNKAVDIFFPLHWSVRNIYFLQILLSRISPCLFYYSSFPFLSKKQHLELTRLDSYDSLTDFHKHYSSVRSIKKCLKSMGCENFRIKKNGIGLEVRAKK